MQSCRDQPQLIELHNNSNLKLREHYERGDRKIIGAIGKRHLFVKLRRPVESLLHDCLNLN